MENRLVDYKGKGLWYEGNGCDYKGVARDHCCGTIL